MLRGFRTGLTPLVQMINATVLTTVINVLVIVLVVYMLVAAGLKRDRVALENRAIVNSHRETVRQPRAKPLAGPRLRRLEEYRSIAARDLFGTGKQAVKPGDDKEEVRIENMPLASLQLRLMGTVVASDPAMRKAIIAEANGRNERMYREGDRVKGATIKKILRYAVVLNTGKRDEVLKMEIPRKDKPNPPSGRLDRRVPVQAVTHSRGEAQQSLATSSLLFETTAFEGHWSGGISDQTQEHGTGSVLFTPGLWINDILSG
ncbi:hypothetical protein DPF_0723 [Desulfoplanes formicivorans]|uniref:Type II secretion system protein GspC N-terminal domain-containing protein n=2 Tax=Desulfoplanes formicivorans TaxID=1592317 RepID=A0A194AD45_9BACT|nr:hypothetical protein DPF_0723 [Desulfoplanes formicivorans]